MAWRGKDKRKGKLEGKRESGGPGRQGPGEDKGRLTSLPDGGGDGLEEADSLRSQVEAMLFLADEPLSPVRLARALGADESEVLSVLQSLQREYRDRDRGIQLRETEGGWRMHVHPAHVTLAERMFAQARRPRLTRAAVETLAIIAYLQPITRAQIANLRGLQSETVVKALEEQGLVREAGRDRSPGGPALYVTTEKFLQAFGLSSLEDLPPLEDFAPSAEEVERMARSLGAGSTGISQATEAVGEGMEDFAPPASGLEEGPSRTDPGRSPLAPEEGQT